MNKLSIEVDEEQYRRLVALSRVQGKSVEDTVRSLIEQPFSKGDRNDTLTRGSSRTQARREAVPRISELGLLGEKLAIQHLQQHPEFREIRNLNEPIRNHRYADIFSVRDSEKQKGERLVISVKTRNKFSNQFDTHGQPLLNGRYKLLKEFGEQVAREYSAAAAWIAVQVDALRNTYSCYFGHLSECSTNGINMNERYTRSYLCLAEDVTPPFNMRHLHNLD
jgi:hypothetical protein